MLWDFMVRKTAVTSTMENIMIMQWFSKDSVLAVNIVIVKFNKATVF